jgi:hypothetical protein
MLVLERRHTHSLTHTLTSTHTHSHTHLTHSLSHSLTHSFTHSLSHSPTHSRTHTSCSNSNQPRVVQATQTRTRTLSAVPPSFCAMSACTNTAQQQAGADTPKGLGLTKQERLMSQ